MIIPVLIEIDEVTIYKLLKILDIMYTHIEDALTEINTVSTDTDMTYNEEQLFIRVHEKIPLYIITDLNPTEEIKETYKFKQLINLIKDSLSNLDKEWTALHFQLKHLPHSKMCRLIEHRYLDNIFKKVSRLCCPDYIIFTQAKIRWQFKSTKNSIKSYIRKSQHNAPGACISTDQIVFPIPGIILQVKGKIMKAFFTVQQFLYIISRIILTYI